MNFRVSKERLDATRFSPWNPIPSLNHVYCSCNTMNVLVYSCSSLSRTRSKIWTLKPMHHQARLKALKVLKMTSSSSTSSSEWSKSLAWFDWPQSLSQGDLYFVYFLWYLFIHFSAEARHFWDFRGLDDENQELSTPLRTSSSYSLLASQQTVYN